MGRRHYDLTALRAEWALVGYTLPAGGTTTRALGFNGQELSRACRSRKQAEAVRPVDLTADNEEGAAAVPQSGAKISRERCKELRPVPVDQCYRSAIEPIERTNIQEEQTTNWGTHLTSQGSHIQPGPFPPSDDHPSAGSMHRTFDFTTPDSDSPGMSGDSLEGLMIGGINAFGAMEDPDLAQAKKIPTACSLTGESSAPLGQQELLAKWDAIPEADRIISPDTLEMFLSEQPSIHTMNTSDGMVTDDFDYSTIDLDAPLDMSWFDMHSTMS